MKKYASIVLVILLFASCDLLTTRDVEEPQGRGSNFIVPTIPQYLFQNLQSSLSEKVIENYMNCFVDSAFLSVNYRFVPAAGAVSKFQNLNDWDLNAERSYINNVFSSVQSSAITLRLINEESTPQGDSSIYFFDYSLDVPLEAGNATETFQGSIRFTIRLDGRNQWVITKWEDIQFEDSPSWSELKGRFY